MARLSSSQGLRSGSPIALPILEGLINACMCIIHLNWITLIIVLELLIQSGENYLKASILGLEIYYIYVQPTALSMLRNCRDLLCDFLLMIIHSFIYLPEVTSWLASYLRLQVLALRYCCILVIMLSLCCLNFGFCMSFIRYLSTTQINCNILI